MQIMKALSIRQPWAYLIVNGYKTIENRDWNTRYRGPILIHAGARIDRDFPYEWASRNLQKEQKSLKVYDLAKAETGGIVGYAEIVDCVREHPSPWFVGKYGFVLAKARPLPFIPMNGKLGLFDVSLYPELTAALAA